MRCWIPRRIGCTMSGAKLGDTRAGHYERKLQTKALKGSGPFM